MANSKRAQLLGNFYSKEIFPNLESPNLLRIITELLLMMDKKSYMRFHLMPLSVTLISQSRSHRCSMAYISSFVYATGHIKDPVPLVEKRRGLSPGGRFPPSFLHQVIIITRLNKLQLYVLALKMALDADRA